MFVDEPIRDGLNTGLSISVPEDLTPGSVSARFRLTESTGYSYFGLAPNSEVKDQTLDITAPVPVIALGNRRQWALMTSPQPNTSLTNIGQSHAPTRTFRFTRMGRPRDVRFAARDFATFEVYSSASQFGRIVRPWGPNASTAARVVPSQFTGDALSKSLKTWSRLL